MIPTGRVHVLSSSVWSRSRAHDVLKAIAKNKPTSDSYGIESPSGAVWELVDQCYRAVDQLEMFHDLLAGERKAVEQLQRHRQSVADLRQFIATASKSHENPYVDWASLETTTDPLEVAELNRTGVELGLGPPHIAYEKGADYYCDALDRIAALIEERQQSTDRVLCEFGVNRKSHTKEAAETAAIGWLAEQVDDVFGKPCARHVAVLAEVALNIDEVTEDQVRAALKTRRRKLVHSRPK